MGARDLGRVRGCAAEARPGDLVMALSGALKSNAQERRVLIEILALCGVLQSRQVPGYLERFVPVSERVHTGQHLNDWRYPAIWWRGVDGIDEAAVALYFRTCRGGRYRIQRRACRRIPFPQVAP